MSTQLLFTKMIFCNKIAEPSGFSRAGSIDGALVKWKTYLC
jgi:hypothetical protein